MLAFGFTHGQVVQPRPDSVSFLPDIQLSRRDLALPADTLKKLPDSLSRAGDTTRIKKKSDIETTINYKSTDSLTLDITRKLIGMYGKGEVTYGEVDLTADNIHVNYITNEIMANGKKDSTGREIDKPVFKQGEETYETQDMRYNYKSKKAIIHGVVTKQNDAVMQGKNVKRDQFGNLYIDQAKYTTCDLPDPHFYIQATRIKVIPNNEVVAGPFYMRVHDIPLPIGWGFGLFPQPRKKASGIIVPQYGEEQRRGFYLRNGGYYFAISDYLDLEATGELFSKGGWGVNLASTYISRYSYNGNVSIRFNKQKTEQEGISSSSRDFWINWSHSPKSKGTGRFSANVSAGSQTYNQNNLNYYDLNRNLNQEFSSNVSYSKTFQGTPFNLGLNARIQQNTATKVYNIQLPDLSLSANRLYHFKGKSGTSSTWWQKLNVAWNMVATNNITNNAISQGGSQLTLANPNSQADSIVPFNWAYRDVIYDRMQNGVKHTLPVSTSMKFLKYFTLSPSLNYTEVWYFKRLNYTWLPEQKAVRIDTLRKFSRVYNYSAGAAISTKIYGTLNFNKGKILAIRHVMSPSLGISFAPDFSSEKYNFYQKVQVDSTGRTMKLSRYNGFIYGTPSTGRSASLSFGLQNNIEMKVKSKNDTSDKPVKVPLLDNLGFTTGYNFLADSFNLAPFNFNARTRLLNKKIDVSLNWTVDPYVYTLDTSYVNSSGRKVVVQNKINEYAWNVGKGIGQLSRLGLSLSTSLNPKARNNKDEQVKNKNLSPDEQAELQYITAHPEDYIDFNIPWNLRVNYSFTYSRTGYLQPTTSQSVNFSGDLSLTKKWKVVFSSAYDFKQKQFISTNINISRDLHCWQMSLSWIPFGRYQSYNITINAKSTLLQDLKLNRRRSWYDK